MFTRDISRMTDTELSAHVRNLIETRQPESLYLDYKEALDVTKQSGKKELAKDISSFANEQGGAVIYGVPQIRDGDLPRPKPLAECGIDIPAGLPEQMGNVLLSAVQPVLHALTIKVVEIPEIKPKKLLLVYHPESYWKPHMVQGYRDGRYHRRTDFQVVRMSEREVEAAYRAREASRRHAADFFETGLFGPTAAVQIRAVACPVLPGQFKERMLQPGFREWLDANEPRGRTNARKGTWLPFLDGWRFLGLPEGSISGKQYEIRVFHIGAVCLNLDLCASSADGRVEPCIESGFLLLDKVGRDLRHLFVAYSSTVFEDLSLKGPVVIRFELHHALGLNATGKTDEFRYRQEIREEAKKGSNFELACRRHDVPPQEPGQPYTDGETMTFDEESSAEEMLDQPDQVLGRLMTRISTAFGLWGDEED